MRLVAQPATGAYTYGLKRGDILSVDVNGLTLMPMAGQSIHRARAPRTKVQPMVAMLIAKFKGDVQELTAAYDRAHALIMGSGGAQRRTAAPLRNGR
jgi:hypothetical protein